ncbi:amino acid ABC transporter permease [Limnobaculum parvum]|uniref:Amino acid ABC transporter permease n=1 Tax=Limnobaculum parvum TaxID=2172103 RepID=A0A2Y9TVR1_9GAMM|nr:amino acid ABC transporter permease [Limnobaculum parvum]AWH87702.1 amino acid ABC transporter permease [Limnobaculum parvum]
MFGNWNWGIFLEQAPFGNATYLDWLWAGTQITIALSICSWILAFILGSLFGILRTVPNRVLSGIGTLYVALFRNVPLIVQFFIWYLLAPELLPASVGDWFKGELDPNIQFFIISVCCLGFFTGARVCEQVKTGILTLPRGQKGAALALGLTLPQAYRHVLLPNAYRIIIPPLTSEMLNMVKNSAVASTIGLIELSAQANKLLEFTGRSYESFFAVTVAYVLINIVVMRLMKLVEKKTRLPGTFGG